MFLLRKIIISLIIVTSISIAYAQNKQPSLVIFCSGGLMSTLQTIAPSYQAKTGIDLIIKTAPSMGNTPQSTPQRLTRKEPADLVVLVDAALPSLNAKHFILPNSRVKIANSYIAMAVKEGTAIPTINTTEEFRQVLLNAHSIAYSDSASGRYISATLFKKLGIAAKMKKKSHMIPATPVGKIVAEGKAEIGFQQLSELKPIKDIHIVGLIPKEVQKTTLYSAAIIATSQHPQQAKDFINYLSSDEVAQIIQEKGLTPLH